MDSKRKVLIYIWVVGVLCLALGSISYGQEGIMKVRGEEDIHLAKPMQVIDAVMCNGDLWMDLKSDGTYGDGRPFKLPTRCWPGGSPQAHGWHEPFIFAEHRAGIGEKGEDYYRTYRGIILPGSGTTRWGGTGEYKDPLIGEVHILTSLGVQMDLIARSWSQEFIGATIEQGGLKGWLPSEYLSVWPDGLMHHGFNDFVLFEIKLTNTGNVDYDLDGTPEITGNDLKEFCFGIEEMFYYVRALSVGGSGFKPGDATLADDRVAYDPVMQIIYGYDADLPEAKEPGDDTGMDDKRNKWWLGVHTGWVDIACLDDQGNEKRTIFGTPAIGWFRTYLGKDTEIEGWPPEAKYWRYRAVFMGRAHDWDGPDEDLGPSPRLFDIDKLRTLVAGWDTFAWVAKWDALKAQMDAGENVFRDGIDPTTLDWSDPANMKYIPNGDDKLWEPKNLVSTDYSWPALGWGPFELKVGESMTLVLAYVAGPGADGGLAENYEAWNHADFPGADEGEGEVVGKKTNELPEGDPYALNKALTGIRLAAAHARLAYQMGYDYPKAPPAPEVKIVLTPRSTIIVKWKDNSETPDPDYTGDEANDFKGYRVYRSYISPKIDTRLYGPGGVQKPGKGDEPTKDEEGKALPWVNGDQLPNYQYGLSFTTKTAEAANKLMPGGNWGPYYQLAPVGEGFITPEDEEYKLPSDDPDYAAGYRYYYEDKAVTTGFKYYYTVIAYDKGHSSWTSKNGAVTISPVPPLASNWSMNFNGWPGMWPEEATYMPWAADYFGLAQLGNPVATITPANEDEVMGLITVVPNPYKSKALWDVGTEHNIKFMNLPPKCTIDIYDVSGVHIQHIDYDDQGTGIGTYTFNLYSKAGVEMASGIYIYRVETPGGRVKTGFFTIIK